MTSRLVQYAADNGSGVLVLTKPNCPQCVATKRRLLKLGIPFDEELLSPKTIALAQDEDIRSAPVVVVPNLGNDGVWGGFQPTKLDAIR